MQQGLTYSISSFPDHYEALARLVDLMRRAGKLDEVPRFIELAESASSRVHLDAGYNYCKGLCEWSVIQIVKNWYVHICWYVIFFRDAEV